MFALFRVLQAALAVVLVALVLGSCVTTGSRRPHTQSPSILNDSVLAALSGLLPAPDSTRYLDVPRRPLAQLFGPSTARKDKRQVHITVYNAPAKVKGGSTAVSGDGNVTADNRKARGPVAVGDSASATDNTKAGQKGGAAATGACSTATAVTEQAGPAWWAWLLVFLLGVVVGVAGTVYALLRRWKA
ncbi:hypothetical protein [Hymenobacter coalescens]